MHDQLPTTEPMPRLSRSNPRTPSSTPSRVFANGTSGAQHAMPKSATRKASRVARRVAGRSAECMGTPGKQGGGDRQALRLPRLYVRGVLELSQIVLNNGATSTRVPRRVAFGTIFASAPPGPAVGQNTGSFRAAPVSSRACKNIPLYRNSEMTYVSPIPAHQEGRSCVVTVASRVAVDAAASGARSAGRADCSP